MAFGAAKLHDKGRAAAAIGLRQVGREQLQLGQETAPSFGSAPPKLHLSPPISLVMSALLIERREGGLGGPGGAWGGRGSDGAQAHSLLPCVCSRLVE